MQAYDIIGDIHGQVDELIQLLESMDYEIDGEGCYAHKSRRVIFLGDFIDRGKKQKETLNIVRAMIDSGSALTVMGNHEYNAITYYFNKREHTESNRNVHIAFLNEYENDAASYKDIIEWFMSLPLWLDLNELRIIHACWDRELVETVQKELNGKSVLTHDYMVRSSVKDSDEYNAIETLLKGKEIPLKEGFSFKDKDGKTRHHIRVRWWDQSATTYKSAFMGPEDARTHIPEDDIEGDHLVEYGHHEPPVMLGHYWMDDEKPGILAPNIACLDYSVAKPGGKLVAYRWDGETDLNSDKFVWVHRES